MVLDLDLNYPPCVEDTILTSDSMNLSLNLAGEVRLSHRQESTNLEPIDDEVVICSPRSFAEARDKSKRNREVMEVIDVETDVPRESTDRLSFSNNRRRRAPPEWTTVNCDLCINLEVNEKTKSENAVNLPELPASVPWPQEAPSFNCPVCMSPLVEETSTKCGHIFCKNCIDTAIAAQKKCPTCRRKLKAKDTFRIYLPASN